MIIDILDDLNIESQTTTEPFSADCQDKRDVGTSQVV